MKEHRVEHKYEVRKIMHPSLNMRDISIIYIDDKLDLPSMSFLVEEARSGGRKGTVSGLLTHGIRAYKIVELYRNIEVSFGVSWREVEEEHIRMIRNGMLCLDMNDRCDLEHYDYEPIKNDTVNQKLATWMKFFNHQQRQGELSRIVMNTTMVDVYRPDKLLQHIDGIRQGKLKERIERWDLMVKPSPKKLYYPAISKLEFEAFRSQLKNNDPVYEAIALLMVETGLRVGGAMRFDIDVFKGWMRYLNIGKEMDECISVKYINKGAETKECELPIRVIAEIQHCYRASHYAGRLSRYQNDWNSKDEPLWLRVDGKRINEVDVRKAFSKASIAMGRSDNINPHRLRHTFATWTLIDTCEKEKIPLGVLGDKPHMLIKTTLMAKLGHTSDDSTLRYTLTAYKMLNTGSSGPKVTTRTIEKSKVLKSLILEQAMEQFGDKFDSEKYDHIEFARSLGFAVEYL